MGRMGMDMVLSVENAEKYYGRVTIHSHFNF